MPRTKMRQDINREMLEALKLMVKAYDELIPGIGFISCKDYALVNEAPIKARAAISKAESHA